MSGLIAEGGRLGHADADILFENGNGHFVQFYDQNASLVERLARFVGAGLAAGEAVVFIATRQHQDDLERLLHARGLASSVARDAGRFVVLDAAETLAQIMGDDGVDEGRFRAVVGSVLSQAAARAPRFRAFGEMVAELWKEGRRDAAIALEQMWNRLAAEHSFFLLCAYPLSGFGMENDGEDLKAVCREHSRVIPTERYMDLSDPGERLRTIAELQQRAGALEPEIAQRKSAEEARARLAAIVECSEDAIVGKTLQGIITSWNSGAQRLFGYTAEEMIGQPILRIIPRERTAESSQILATIARGQRVEHFETERVRKDGTRINISLTVSPIRDSAGRIIGASKIARDVTERKRAETERLAALRELSTLYTIGQVVSAELNCERLLQTITDAAAELSGAEFGAFFYNADDEEGGHYSLYALSGASREAFEKFGAPRNTAILAPTFAGEGIVRIDDVRTDPRYRHNAPHPDIPEGDLPVTSYLAVPVVSRTGKVFGGLFLGHPQPAVFTEAAERVVRALATQAAIALDNSRLYEAEQQARRAAEEANQTKDQFLAMLSHELRNPLSAVHNAIMTAELDPSRRQRALSIARRGTDQLIYLVDDLLDVARITRGRITLRKITVPLSEIVGRAIDSMRGQFEDRALAITLSLPSYDLDVEGDPARLEQVIGNLLANAAKYTDPNGQITVTLDRDGGEAVLRLRDTGIGIAPAMLPRIFDLFVQADESLDRTSGGLGIGLTLVRQLVELHGGRVTAHSEGIGRGTELVVRLPIVARAKDGLLPGSSVALHPHTDVRVLIVEDNPDAAESLTLLLELLGLRVRAVSDGFAALEAARANPPDVMLIDIGLPGMDGYELASRIRADEVLCRVTLVALTGYSQDEDRRRSISAGFDYHLVKPVDVEKFQNLVTEIAPQKPLTTH